jgi:hypothetical protein
VFAIVVSETSVEILDQDDNNPRRGAVMRRDAGAGDASASLEAPARGASFYFKKKERMNETQRRMRDARW